MLVTVISDLGPIIIPTWVVDIDSFRRWTDCDDFPEHGKVWWLCGEVWADMSKEQIFTHLVVKNEISGTVTGIVKTEKRGLFIPDGLLLSNFAADICGNPDATFVSNDTLRSDLIRFIEGKDGGYVELQGSPDWVLEVISKSSLHKDDVVLRRAYWEAGVREYWLVDARKEPLRFEILQHTARGYIARRKKDGWMKSDVFGKSFRLTQSTNALGHPEYSLEVR
ncbi:MAG: Uma2 family endonuclease [Planctomycetes bacterium]|nr:Uma2 family endonuclease [Planctomycetota bacterium]